MVELDVKIAAVDDYEIAHPREPLIARHASLVDQMNGGLSITKLLEALNEVGLTLPAFQIAVELNEVRQKRKEKSKRKNLRLQHFHQISSTIFFSFHLF